VVTFATGLLKPRSVIKDVLSGAFSRTPQPSSTTPVYRLKDVTLEKKAELFQRFADRLGWPMKQPLLEETELLL
jgi:hypothetical protein